MISPVFSSVGYTSLSLSFRHYYRFLGTESANVDISTDGGTTWTTLQTWTSTQGAPTNFANPIINLNAYLGQANLRLRFRYVMSWDWYWIIDDVIVSGNATLPITYSWSPAAGLSNPGITNPTASPAGTTTYSLTASHGACSAPTSSVTVTVAPGASAGPASGTPILCVNTPLTAINHTTSAATGIGSPSGLPPGVSASWASDVITISGTPTSPGVYNYSIPLISSCGSADATGTITVNPQPAAPIITANGPLTFCSGGSVILSSNYATGNLWSNGATTQSVTISGNETLTVTHTDANICTSPASSPVTVTVTPSPPVPVISAGGPTAFCQGGSVQLSSTGGSVADFTITVSGPSWLDETSWSLTDGLGNLIASGGPFAIGSTNTTPVSTSASGPFTFNIETQGIINDNIANYSVVCNNSSTTLTSGTLGGGQFFSAPGLSCGLGGTLTWSPAAGLNTTSGPSVIASPAVNTTYTVTASDGSGCTSSSSIAITVNPLPPAPVISANGSTTFCQGDSVTLSSNYTTGNLWSNGATTQSVTIYGNQTLTVIHTDVNSCTSAASAPTVVNVNPLPGNPVITPGGPTTFCLGGNVSLNAAASSTANFTVTVSGSGFLDETGWSLVDGLGNIVASGGPYGIGSFNTIPVTTSTPGPFTFNIETQGFFNDNIANYSVLCNTNGNTLTSGTLAGGQTFSAGGLNCGEPISYSWSPAAGLNTTAGSSVIASPTSNTTYTVTASIIATGCSSTASIPVTVNQPPAAPVIKANGPTTFCAGGSVILSSNYATGNLWSNGATTQSVTISGNETLTVTHTDANTCTSAASAPVTVTVNPLPAAPIISANGPTTFCAGGSVTLSSNYATGNLWSNGATTQSVTISGNETLTVTFTDGNICTSPASSPVTVTVNPLPPAPVISAGGPTTFCQGGSVVLSSNYASGNLWSNGATTQSVTISGNQTLTVIHTDVNSCTSAASSPVTVTVNPLPAAPIISANGATVFCAGDSVILSSNYATGNQWSNGATTQSITVTTPGSYTVTHTSAGNCSSAASAPVVVTFTTAPVAPIISASGPTTFCTGGSVTLTSNYAAGNQWSNGSTTQSITVSNSGTFTVTVTNASGCSTTSAPVSVLVGTIPNQPNVSVDGPTEFCQGGSVTLTSNYANGNLWSNGATTQSITVSTSGSYSVTVTDVAGCSSSSSNPAVIVNVVSSATASFTVSGSAPTFTFNNTSTGATSYEWDFGDGSPISNAVSPTHTYTSTGSFIVTLSAYGVCGVSKFYFSVFVPNTGISDPEVQAGFLVNLFPNPAQDMVTVTYNGTAQTETSLKIFDMNGKVVLTEMVSQPGTEFSKTLDLQHLMPGVYNLSMETADGIIAVKRFVKL